MCRDCAEIQRLCAGTRSPGASDAIGGHGGTTKRLERGVVAPPRCSSTIGVAETAPRSGAGDRPAILGQRRAKLPARVMPSFVNTLRRCHSTVRALMKSWAPISGFDRPSRARRAICVSWAVRSSRVSTCACAPSAPVAEQLPPRALGEALHADRVEHLVRDAQLAARVDPAVRRRSHSPYSRWVRASSARTRVRPRCSMRLAEGASATSPVAQEGSRAGLDPERPVGAGSPAPSRPAVQGLASRGRFFRFAWPARSARSGPSSRRRPRDTRWRSRRRRAPRRTGPGRCRGRRARTRRWRARCPRRGRRPRAASSRSASRLAYLTSPRGEDQRAVRRRAIPVASSTDCVSATAAAAADNSPQNTSTGIARAESERQLAERARLPRDLHASGATGHMRSRRPTLPGRRRSPATTSAAAPPARPSSLESFCKRPSARRHCRVVVVADAPPGRPAAGRRPWPRRRPAAVPLGRRRATSGTPTFSLSRAPNRAAENASR